MNFNSQDIQYKNPFGAVATGTPVRIRFPIATWVPVNRMLFVLRLGDESNYYDMDYITQKDGFNIYETTVTVNTEGVYFYRFEMRNYDGTWYYGKGNDSESVCGHNLPEWQLTVYKNTYKTPDFAKGGIIYHIFADRFFKAGNIKTNRQYRLHKDFSELPEVISPDGKYYADDFFGGNFLGIEKKLSYLKSLGVTIIYLSPIFSAYSNHRYDTADFLKLDELLGTEDDFKRLIDKANKLGIKIILDGVFNHSGQDSVYFNRYNKFDSVGAYQSKQSPYYNWYYFDKFPDDYKCWWGCKNVPTLNKDSEGYRHLILGVGGVIEKWSKFGVGGWRLDVVDELPIDFTYRLCDAIKRNNKNALIIGEVWEDASTKVSYSQLRPYLLGGQLDGVMNYPFKCAIVDYAKGANARYFKEKVMSICENYPKQSLDCCMNIIGTHDTFRIITELSNDLDIRGKSKEEKRGYKMSAEQFDRARQKLKMASLLQFTLPGIPSIYYGDEVGLEGFEDPLNRAPFPWDNIDQDILNHYKKLGKIRSKYKNVFCGDIKFLNCDNLLVYQRFDKNDKILVVLNNTNNELSYTFCENYIDLFDRHHYKKDAIKMFKPNSFAIFVANTKQ